MVIEESNLKFEFEEEVEAIKFDDTDFYRKEFNKLPEGKGVDIIACSSDCIQFIEIKNCLGHEAENMWRTSVDNSKIGSAPRELDVDNRDSFDIEVARKVAATISCLYGAWTKSERTEKASKLTVFWKNLNDIKLIKDRKQLLVILFLEGNFNQRGSQSRSKKMVMQRIQASINSKLSWLNCQVSVVDSNTYNKRCFQVS